MSDVMVEHRALVPAGVAGLPAMVAGIDWYQLAPGAALAEHEHRGQDVLTLVLAGTVAHNDAWNNGGTAFPDDVFLLRGGRGCMHHEFNPSAAEAAEFLQIRFHARNPGAVPSYAVRTYFQHEHDGAWLTVAAPHGNANALALDADAEVRIVSLPPGGSVAVPAGTVAMIVAGGTVACGGDVFGCGTVLLALAGVSVAAQSNAFVVAILAGPPGL